MRTPLPGALVNVNFPPERSTAFFHSFEPEVASVLGPHLKRIEAAAVVDNAQCQFTAATGESNFDVRGAAVQRGVVDRFAGNHEQIVRQGMAYSDRGA